MSFKLKLDKEQQVFALVSILGIMNFPRYSNAKYFVDCKKTNIVIIISQHRK